MSIQHPIISADDHMDLMALPPELFSERLPARLAHRAPRVVERDGQSYWLIEDRLVGPSGRKPDQLYENAAALYGIQGPESPAPRAGEDGP